MSAETEPTGVTFRIKGRTDSWSDPWTTPRRSYEISADHSNGEASLIFEGRYAENSTEGELQLDSAKLLARNMDVPFTFVNTPLLEEVVDARDWSESLRGVDEIIHLVTKTDRGLEGEIVTIRGERTTLQSFGSWFHSNQVKDDEPKFRQEFTDHWRELADKIGITFREVEVEIGKDNDNARRNKLRKLRKALAVQETS